MEKNGENRTLSLQSVKSVLTFQNAKRTDGLLNEHPYT